MRLCFLSTLCAAALAFSTACFAEDTIRVAIPYAAYKLDPLSLEEPINRVIFQNIARSLITYENSKIGSVLITQLEHTDDYRHWSFVPREDLSFAKNSPCTADNIAASLDFLKSLATTRSSTKSSAQTIDLKDKVVLAEESVHSENLSQATPASLIDKLTAIESVSTQTITVNSQPRSKVEISLKSSEPSFDRWVFTLPLINTSITGQMANQFGYGTNIATLGPYYVETNRPQLGITLKATPDYFEPTFPRISSIEFKVFSSASDALSAIRTASVDVILLPTPQQIEEIKLDSAIETIQSPLVTLQQTPKITGGWQLQRSFWSTPNDDNDRLLTTQIIVRKTLQLDQAFRSRFDFSGVTSTLVY